MAKFILGSVITNIAGSVGGTTFRRVANGFSMYNKIKGTSYSRLLQNPRVPQIANIFQRWSLLSDSERSGWNAQALLVTFPDKFGNPKNLTGRELFSKANIQLLPFETSIDDSTGFTTVINPLFLNGVNVNWAGNSFELVLGVPAGSVDFMVSMELSNRQIYQPTFKSRKVFSFGTIAIDTDLQIFAGIVTEFPYAEIGMYYAIYVQAINEFGMVSPYQYFIGQIE